MIVESKTIVESNTIVTSSTIVESNTNVPRRRAEHDRRVIVESNTIVESNPILESNTTVASNTIVESDTIVSSSSCRTRWSSRRRSCPVVQSNTIVESNTIVPCRRLKHDCSLPSCRTRSCPIVESNTIVRSGMSSTGFCDELLDMDREGKPSKRRASRSSGSMEQSSKKTKGTPTSGVGTDETPASKDQRTPVPRGASSTGSPSARVRGSGRDVAVLMSGGAAGQEEEAAGRQGKSAMDVVPRRRRSGETSVAAPMKSRTTSTKELISLVRPPRYDLEIPSRPQYFEDDDKENSEEDSEHDEENEEGGDDRGERGEEAEVGSEATINERGGQGELEGGLGIEYEDEGQEEETTSEGGYAQRLPPGQGHWGADRGWGGMHNEVTVVPAHTDAARLAEKKRKIRQERRSALDSKRTKQEGGTKREQGHKRKLKLLSVYEAVQRTREAEEAMKKKRQPRKKAAKEGVMEKTYVFPPDQPQSDEDAVGKTVTRPPSLQTLPPGNSSGHLSKGFLLEFDENGNQRPKMQFISVKLDMILDIPDEEFRYNQRFLGQELIDDLYKTMVESGEAAIRDRTTGAGGVNVCTLYEKPVLFGWAA
ncbi:hypothetical protein CBR_g45863 [Chara braunii]|uniref:Uncharacterized protein n=1 Tax=Chara braunii TaxID=69332 RepID=A0A388LZR7_CHABU|nr:hypothetical protein CBR_g45863 [Chara braunii]|eukprot:GBG87709.1 hypothetical protein CBR_g45863 [Chara braunii]